MIDQLASALRETWFLVVVAFGYVFTIERRVSRNSSRHDWVEREVSRMDKQRGEDLMRLDRQRHDDMNRLEGRIALMEGHLSEIRKDVKRLLERHH